MVEDGLVIPVVMPRPVERVVKKALGILKMIQNEPEKQVVKVAKHAHEETCKIFGS